MSKIKSILTVMALMPCCAFAESFLISTPNTSLDLEGEKEAGLTIAYYGERLTDSEVTQVGNSGGDLHSQAYPAFGFGYNPESALSVLHPNGELALQLVLKSCQRIDEKDYELVTFVLKDKKHPFQVELKYKAYKKNDVIEMWSELSHGWKKPVVLKRMDSAHLPFKSSDAWLSHLYGNWGNEGIVQDEPLTTGMKVIKNRDGVRNAHLSHAEVMISLDGKAHEKNGRVIGAALCWSGNYQLRIDCVKPHEYDFFAGIDNENADYTLKPQEIFITPELAVTYSTQGIGGASRTFHRWGRDTHLAHGNQLRDILLNSWEGVYLNVDEGKMKGMIRDIAALGGELFVMDDGWFGNKYKRNEDNAALGDWIVDREKLPNGIAPLLEEAKRNNIKFGIWIEPECVNTTSELFEKHPDWIICPEGRTPEYGRGGTQLILDLSNPDVQNFVFGVVDNLKTEFPQLSYIKWDMNTPLSSFGSYYLSDKEQSHLYIAYHKGLRNVLERIRSKYPDLVMQDCASGGGRVNYGLLPYFDEYWTSDNTDALQRIYMQWGNSYFFPAIAMGSHVSASPNHQTGRSIPLKFRFDVAMSARLGMEMQPKDMSESERTFSRKAIETYKQIRPLVQFGDLYRLISPYSDQGVSSLMYCSEDKSEAVFFAYKLKHFVAQPIPTFRMDGLNPDANYRITELNAAENSKSILAEGKTFSGKFLMGQGVEIPMWKEEYASRVLKIEQVN